jgi:signal peptidase I
VSEPAPISYSPLANDLPSPAIRPDVPKRNLLAVLLSAVLPGAGQLLLGQRRKGIILLLILGSLLFSFWPLRFLRFYEGLVGLYCGWIALYLYAACSAYRSHGPPATVRPSYWAFIAIVPLTVLSLSVLGAVVTRASGFQSFKVPSTSMEKTILQGDQIVADMRHYRSRSPKRGDIILFKRQGAIFIKRVIATGGDTIQGMNRDVFVNGEKVVEPYIQHTLQGIPPWTPNWIIHFGPVTVGNGNYFVIGDNRDISVDSRSPEFGSVEKNTIVGKALCIFSSDHLGKSLH